MWTLFGATVHIWGVESNWASTYAFLEQHAASIETTDLEMDDDTTQSIGWVALEKPFVLSLDFWDTFTHLWLLRCSWYLLKFEALPQQQHILNTFGISEYIEKSAMLIDILWIWVGDWRTKALEKLVLGGNYLSNRDYQLDPQVQAFMMQLHSRGTRLVSPSGSQWHLNESKAA